mgnify:CR=1 FL=1
MRPGFAALLSLSFAWATPALAQADGLAVPERTPLRGVGVYERPPLPPAAPADTTEIMQVVERPPSLIGGLEGLQERMIYPESMRRAGIEGTVYVQFIVDEEGRVQSPVCARAPHKTLCDAALTALIDSRFTPGTQEGTPVKVRFTMPVQFNLQGGTRCV